MFHSAINSKGWIINVELEFGLGLELDVRVEVQVEVQIQVEVRYLTDLDISYPIGLFGMPSR